MKSNRLGFVGALVAGAIAVFPVAPAGASPVLIGTTGDATGIDGLIINLGPGPITYDVAFVNAAFSNGYITFGTYSGALEAAGSLTNALNGLGVTGLTGATYDSNLGLFAMVPYIGPSSSSVVCGTSGPKPCFAFQAAQLNPANPGPWQATSDLVAPTFSAISNADFAVFTVAPAPAPTPIPGALPGMITVLGGGGLLGWWRRKRRAAAEAAA
jgi:hypothetical protein